MNLGFKIKMPQAARANTNMPMPTKSRVFLLPPVSVGVSTGSVAAVESSVTGVTVSVAGVVGSVASCTGVDSAGAWGSEGGGVTGSWGLGLVFPELSGLVSSGSGSTGLEKLDLMTSSYPQVEQVLFFVQSAEADSFLIH